MQFVGVLDAFRSESSSYGLRALFAVERRLSEISEGRMASSKVLQNISVIEW